MTLLHQKNFKSKINFILNYVACLLIFGIFVLIGTGCADQNKPKDIVVDEQISLQASSVKEDFESFIYALDRVVLADGINADLNEIYKKMDLENINKKSKEEFTKSIALSGELVSKYKDIDTHYQLARNKLDTIKSPEMESIVIGLKNAIFSYTLSNRDKIEFSQHLYNTYVLEQKDDYSKGNELDISVSYLIFENSFKEMDKLVFGNFSSYIDDVDREHYQYVKDYILDKENSFYLNE